MNGMQSLVVMRQLSIKHWTFQLLLLAMITGSQQIGMSHISNDDAVQAMSRSTRTVTNGIHPNDNHNNNNNDYYYNHDAIDMNRLNENVGVINGSSAGHNNVQCPSFSDNSACPCYKFEDGECANLPIKC